MDRSERLFNDEFGFVGTLGSGYGENIEEINPVIQCPAYRFLGYVYLRTSGWYHPSRRRYTISILLAVGNPQLSRYVEVPACNGKHHSKDVGQSDKKLVWQAHGA